MANINIDIASEFTGKKAFKQAENSTEKLSKNVKKLAGALGLAFGGQAILAFGKASIKAAAEDEKAQKQLALALKNVGLSRDAAASEDYIQKLQSEFGIVDDKLRPAYQTLAIATRDTQLAQKLLNLSLDISASTGKDLGSVTAALSRAYLGNNTALGKLGVGISKADLKAGKFEDIVSQLQSTFAGSATAAANTFQGSIDKLGVASANVSEIIGTGLIDAVRSLSEEDGVDNLAKAMESAALSMADFIRGLGQIASFKVGTETKSLLGLLTTPFKRSLSAGPLGAITRLGTTSRVGGPGGFPQGAPAQYQTGIDARAAAAAAAADAKARKAAEQAAAKLAAAQKKTLKAQQDALKLAKARAVFDLQKIQIEAALKGKISAEDEIRLKLMKAIEEENLTNIEKYQKALEKAQEKSKELADALAAIKASEVDNPFAKWPEYVKTAIELTNSVAQASLQAGLAAGAKLSEALSGARYAAQGAATAAAAADAAAIAGAYGSATAAAAAQAKAAQEAAAAQLATITSGSKAQQEALAAQIKAQQEALEAQGAAALAALKKRLAEEKAALDEAAAERTATVGTETLVKIIAGSAAGSAEAQAAAATAAAIAAAEQAAQLAAINAASAAAIVAAEVAAERGSTGAPTQIAVTITGDPFTDPNAVAEKVVEIIRGAGNRGTVDVFGID